MRFRKKPVVIDAWQWNESKATLDTLQAFGLRFARHDGHVQSPDACHNLRIDTLEGVMRVDAGDWIIRGVKGEFYPCKAAIFEATYEPVTE